MHMNRTVTQYRFGNTVFRIETPVPMMQDPRFEAFAADLSESADFSLIVEALPPQSALDQDWPALLERDGNEITVSMNTKLLPSIPVANLMVISHADHLLTERESFILHASYVLHEGQAILFCAPCGTGKSTQAHFWKSERGSTVVNEDRVLIFRRNGIYYAGGIWATGSAGVTQNSTAPIRAIILLGQGPENRVTELRPSQKIIRLLPQCSYDHRDPNAYDRMMIQVIQMVEGLKILSYDCINHPSSVDDLEAYL